MTSLNLIDYWWVLHLALAAGIVVLYWCCRLLLDWLDYRARRKISFTQTYGGCVYYGQHRPNFRTGERP